MPFGITYDGSRATCASDEAVWHASQWLRRSRPSKDLLHFASGNRRLANSHRRRKTRVLFNGVADGAPFRIELRQGKYRIKVGAPSRSDKPFFAYDEVVFVHAGGRLLVERYVIASDAKCEGSPNIRMVYEFDLQKRTLTSVLNPPWSSDGKVHRFVRSVKLPSEDLFRLGALDFIYRLDDPRGGAAVQRLCSS